MQLDTNYPFKFCAYSLSSRSLKFPRTLGKGGWGTSSWIFLPQKSLQSFGGKIVRTYKLPFGLQRLLEFTLAYSKVHTEPLIMFTVPH